MAPDQRYEVFYLDLLAIIRTDDLVCQRLVLKSYEVLERTRCLINVVVVFGKNTF